MCTHMHTGSNNHSSIDFIVRISLRTNIQIRDYPKLPATSLTQSLPCPCAPSHTLVAQAGPGYLTTPKSACHCGRGVQTRLCGLGQAQAAQYVPALIINYWPLILACLVRLMGGKSGVSRRAGRYSHRSTSLSARSTPCLAPAAGSASKIARGLRIRCPLASR